MALMCASAIASMCSTTGRSSPRGPEQIHDDPRGAGVSRQADAA
jgi:hypothetical protein